MRRRRVAPPLLLLCVSCWSFPLVGSLALCDLDRCCDGAAAPLTVDVALLYVVLYVYPLCCVTSPSLSLPLSPSLSVLLALSRVFRLWPFRCVGWLVRATVSVSCVCVTRVAVVCRFSFVAVRLFVVV